MENKIKLIFLQLKNEVITQKEAEMRVLRLLVVIKSVCPTCGGDTKKVKICGNVWHTQNP